MITPPSTGNLVIGTDNIAVPSDMLEPRELWITGIYYQRLTQKTEREVIASYSYDGNGNRINQQPMIYYFNQSLIQFDNPPDQTYPYLLTYYQQPAPLSGTNLTNFLTSFCQRLVRLGCMVGAAEWAKDNGQGNYDRTYWEQLFEAEILKVQQESDRASRAADVGAVFEGGGSGGAPVWSY